jgi:DUF2407 C-terminal domain/DUF2407 ubiquitin-like domain
MVSDMITIRFVNTTHEPLPVLQFFIKSQSPSPVWAASLKCFVRSSIPKDLKKRTLRLIQCGRVLNNTDCIIQRAGVVKHLESNDKGDAAGVAEHQSYILCAIGFAENVESDEDLEREAVLAEQLDAIGAIECHTSPLIPHPIPPQGFNSLLSPTFTSSDIAHLRSLHLHTLSYRFTPSEIPTGTLLLQLEEEWLESNAPRSGRSSDDPLASLGTFIKGFLTGFFCPLMLFVFWNEEEAMSMEMRYFVGIGAVVNVGFTLLRSVTVKIAGT